MSLRFDGVSGDSRCPADALCIQGGDAIVHVTILEGASAAGYDLHTGNMQPVWHDDLTLSLDALQPYPFSSHPVEPEAYRATVRVTR